MARFPTSNLFLSIELVLCSPLTYLYIFSLEGCLGFFFFFHLPYFNFRLSHISTLSFCRAWELNLDLKLKFFHGGLTRSILEDSYYGAGGGLCSSE